MSFAPGQGRTIGRTGLAVSQLGFGAAPFGNLLADVPDHSTRAAVDAALAAGGEVIGVITDQLVQAEVAHGGLTSLELVADMHQRKARFEALADGFVALPGGFGTVEEVIELLTWNQLGLVRKPVVMLDVQHYWTKLFEWMDGAVEAGFVRRSHRMLAQRAHTVDEALALALAPAPETPSKWLDRDVTGQIPIIPGPLSP
jgi:uncharacterized protein (TIGR00730 family)